MCQAINLAPPRGVRAKDDGPLRLEECQFRPHDVKARPPRHPRKATPADNRIRRHDTPDKICAANTTASQSVTHLLDPAF